MTKHRTLLVIPFLTTLLVAATPGLDEAEVKLPYGELKNILAEAARAGQAREPLAALLSARLRVSSSEGKPVVDATFAVASFGSGLAMVPLIGGALTIESRKPADSRVMIHGAMLCQALDSPGNKVLEARLLPAAGADGMELVVPACPSAILETGSLGTDRAIALKIGEREQILGSNQMLPLPLAGAAVMVRWLAESPK
jgi:hypothetical protein